MSQATTLTGPWLALAKKFGSVNAMATAFGVLPRTIRRWHLGEQHPHPIVKSHIDAVAREHGVTLTWKKATVAQDKKRKS